VDKYGAPRPFAGGEVEFQIKGPGTIVGDNPFDLQESGGAAAIWVRTKPGSSGTITLLAAHSSMGARAIQIVVRK
jgi:beta-galactosidase